MVGKYTTGVDSVTVGHGEDLKMVERKLDAKYDLTAETVEPGTGDKNQGFTRGDHVRWERNCA